MLHVRSHSLFITQKRLARESNCLFLILKKALQSQERKILDSRNLFVIILYVSEGLLTTSQLGPGAAREIN